MNAAAKSAAVNSIAANADAVLVAALAANVGDTNVGSGAAAFAVALAANATKVASLQIHSTCQFVCVWFGVFSCFGFVALSGSRSLRAQGSRLGGLSVPRSHRYYRALVLRIIGRPLHVQISNRNGEKACQ